MRILFISGELIGSALIHRLINEDHEIKLYIDHEDRKDCLDGFVEKTTNWKDELEWVGKEGLIIFDDVIFEGVQDSLREQGYSVFGGDSKSDKLEHNRQLFHNILSKYKLPILPSYDFKTADEAIDFVKSNLGTWVIKQDSHIGMLNYVGQKEDAEDVLDVLETYKEKGVSPVHIQKRVQGVEIGIARYFNGNDWVGPIEVNLEHKPLCNGDIGPLTAEMGTIMWYEDNEEMPLYKETLYKIKDYLKKIKYKGDIDINCIVNKDGIWPLEATPRLGTPATEAQCELHISPWGEFLKAIADGKDYKLNYKKGYSVVVSVAVPPFPYAPNIVGDSNIENCKGMSIHLKQDLNEREKKQIHFEEVSGVKTKNGENKYFLAGKHGYALYVTGYGNTVKEAQKEAYDVVDKIIIPKMFYRTDIGDKFINSDYKKLIKWGFLK